MLTTTMKYIAHGVGGPADVMTVAESALPVLKSGEVLIELLKFHSPAVLEPRNGRGLFSIGPTHFALTVSDLDALCERLRAAGVHFISAPQVSPDGLAKVCFCSDPEGTPIELVQLL